VFADGAYNRVAALLACFLLGLTLIVVSRPSGTKGFAVLPRRWIVTGCTELPNWVLNGRRRSSAIIYGPRAVRTPKPG